MHACVCVQVCMLEKNVGVSCAVAFCPVALTTGSLTEPRGRLAAGKFQWASVSVWVLALKKCRTTLFFFLNVGAEDLNSGPQMLLVIDPSLQPSFVKHLSLNSCPETLRNIYWLTFVFTCFVNEHLVCVYSCALHACTCCSESRRGVGSSSTGLAAGYMTCCIGAHSQAQLLCSSRECSQLLSRPSSSTLFGPERRSVFREFCFEQMWVERRCSLSWDV